MSSNFMHTMPAPHALSRVVPASAHAACSDHVASAMWSKQLTIAPVTAGAVKANRNKGAVGAPGFWDPV